MKAWSVIGLLFAAAIFATIPISPQVTPRGVELSVNQAQAILGHWRRVNRRVHRRAYRRGYYGNGAWVGLACTLFEFELLEAVAHHDQGCGVADG